MKGYYPSEYNNGTVIILDMTKLDTQASRMESIRDQINFITHYLAFTEESTPSNNEQGSGGDLSMNGTNATTPDATVTDSTDIVDRLSNATQPNSTPATPEPVVEVIVLLESPGGGVSQYGLAASHLQRLRSNPNVKLTICIDSIAASGGYMMACMSSPGQLYCAPFAMVGSIGVIGQSLNVQKTLEGYGIRPYVFRGGKMKNPVGMIGDVTKEGVIAMQLMVDRIHDAFRDHVALARKEAFAEAVLSGAFPKQAGKYFQLGASDNDGDESNTEHIMDQVATGDVFLGVQAIKLGLVDRLITSDEYISERMRHGARVMKLINYHRPMGLWSFFGGPSPQHRMNSYRAMVENGGLIDVFKNLVLRAASSFLAWTEQGITTVRIQGAPNK
jgi:serine protease SohB